MEFVDFSLVRRSQVISKQPSLLPYKEISCHVVAAKVPRRSTVFQKYCPKMWQKKLAAINEEVANVIKLLFHGHLVDVR